MVRFTVVLTILFLIPLLVKAQSLTNSYVPGEVIVKYRNTEASGTSSFARKSAFSQKHSRLANKKSFVTKKVWDNIGAYNYKIPDNKHVQDVVAELKLEADVEFAEPNYYVTAATAVAESERLSGQSLDDYILETFGEGILAGAYNQTGASINMASAWDELPGGGTEVIVAVIDTGVDIDHDLLKDAIWTNPGEIAGNHIDDDSNGYVDDVHGWDFVQNDNSPNLPAYGNTGAVVCPDHTNAATCAANSCNDHGTHVSGIIRGATQDIIPSGGYTTLPLAQSYVKIMPVKFLDCDGVGTTSAAINAIYYAVNNGAKILNNSWGGGGFSSSLHAAIDYSYTNGALFVAAAGNSSTNIDNSPMYPAAYPVPNLIAVGASTTFDYLAGFSNYGVTRVHIAAPGVSIVSTVPDDLNNDGTDDTMSMSGTSMAAPMISGIAAMMAYKQPTMIGYQLKNLLLSSYDVPFIDSNANSVIDSGETVKLANKVKNSGRINAEDSIINAKAAAVDLTSPSYDASAYRGPASEGGASAGAGCGLVKKVYEDHEKESQKPIHPLSLFFAFLVFALPIALALFARSAQTYHRRYERFFLGSEVQIAIGSREFLGNVGTISLGGLSFNSQGIFKLGHTIALSVSGPKGSDAIDVEGQIVWMSNNNQYGVKFKNADEQSLVKINEWSKKLKKAD